MRFLGEGIGEVLLKRLREAHSATIAVAYFLPDDATLSVLRSIPALKLFYSEEYAINDPARLERLARSAHVAGVRTDAPIGKLHGKVVLCTRPDGTRWALVGSANLTSSGLFQNREACVAIDSSDPAGDQVVDAVEEWLRRVEVHARSTTDWTEAKRIHAAQAGYRLAPRGRSRPGGVTEPRHWVLKTTSGHTREDHWPAFQAEGVVAIGWDNVGVDPRAVSEVELRAEVRRAYPDLTERQAVRIATKLKRFFRMRPGDRVLLLRGYNVQQGATVFVYGAARIEDTGFVDTGSRWWRFKYPAVIQPVEATLARDSVAEALGKDSLLEAIHEIEPAAFDRFAMALRRESGVVLQV